MLKGRKGDLGLINLELCLCRMSHKKMLQCSMGALLLLLPWFGGLVLGEIGEDFSQCLNFFYKETPPTGIVGQGYQPICQRYQNQYRFATLYHRQHRSPLYSAYKLSGSGNRPDQAWMFEPQLADSCASSEMQNFTKSTLVHQNVKENQAVKADYKNSGFTKGHLNPSGHHETEQDRRATFTLTNIVPQHKTSNNGLWNVLEQEVLESFEDFCTGTMHVITGVMPYESEPQWINNRVSVPEYMWSAYCCPSFKSDLPKSEQSFFPTYAAVGRNDPNSGDEVVRVNAKAKPSVKGYEVKRMSLKDLEKRLSRRLGRARQCQD
ncbi:endonuclease domain-containing 1 protein-like isoform X2 [Pungitius pungitius]|uniref:endonuclease domain-containing 1 protein-like isoform X2 n=1 Tax=Pungitius pungitius TaxID=134920 RepID=UPI002E12C125